jgi:CDP-diacylglycerol---glycerol-3-phosphate 3-phosphatidyltransferase
MDPVADKLLIAAALLSLVSLDRVAAWVAMVIIAREFAVSGLRIAAGQQGVVIPASLLGKVKTIVQSAAVLALIAAPDPDVAWVQALVYGMVVATVVSGADYFLNFRRRLEELSRQRAASEPT